METVSVRLLRNGRAVESGFTNTFAPDGPRELSRYPWPEIEGAALYIGQIYSNRPKWLTFLTGGAVNLAEDLLTGGAGAVLFIPVDGRVYAVCFGHVHIALQDDAFERGFGLRVVLNTVPRHKLRTLDLATPDAVTFQKRVQASRDTDLQEFGVDMLRDLARVAGGTPADMGFAKFVAGKDSLSITCDVDINSIARKCAEIGREYRKKVYKQEFGWVDNLKVVVEEELIQKLDRKLFEALTSIRNGNSSDLHMSPPEIVDYNEGGLLHYNGFGSHGVDYHSLSIEDYVYELDSVGFNGTIEDIKQKHRIGAQSATGGGFTERWRVYDCFVFETSLGSGSNQKAYVLFSGDWYCIEKGFKARVEKFFDSVPKVNIIGPTSCANEKELIEDIRVTRKDLLMMDQFKINPGGVKYAFIEPCEFFSDRKDFIHLKDGHSSGPISHLWAQGVVSADALVSDGDYRAKLKTRIKGSGFESLLPGKVGSFTRSDYRIVFGVMRKPYSDGTLGLPFFSKVSFQSAAERIQQFGIPIAIELIQKPAAESEAEDAAEAEE